MLSLLCQVCYSLSIFAWVMSAFLTPVRMGLSLLSDHIMHQTYFPFPCLYASLAMFVVGEGLFLLPPIPGPHRHLEPCPTEARPREHPPLAHAARGAGGAEAPRPVLLGDALLAEEAR